MLFYLEEMMGNEEPRQMPLFVVVQETEVGDGFVAIYEWLIWWDGLVELLDVYFIEGG
jgi:hypothetical protein